MKQLSIYYNATHASVTVQNGGARRETSAATMPEAMAAMAAADRAVLVRFCQAVLLCEAGQESGPAEFRALTGGER